MKSSCAPFRFCKIKKQKGGVEEKKTKTTKQAQRTPKQKNEDFMRVLHKTHNRLERYRKKGETDLLTDEDLKIRDRDMLTAMNTANNATLKGGKKKTRKKRKTKKSKKKQKGGNISDCINSEDPITYEEIKDIPVDDLIKFKVMEETDENKGKINYCYDRESIGEHIKSKIKQGKIPDLIRDPLSNKILGMEFILKNFPGALETEFNITTPSGDDYVYDEEEEEIIDIDGELEFIREEIENINNEENDNTSAELIEEFSDRLHGLIQQIPSLQRDDFISTLKDLVEDNIISPNKKIQLENIIKNEENDLIGGNKKKQKGGNIGDCINNEDPVLLEEIKNIPVDDLIKFKIREITDENEGKINNCYEKETIKRHIEANLSRRIKLDNIKDPLSNKLLGLDFILTNFPEYRGRSDIIINRGTNGITGNDEDQEGVTENIDTQLELVVDQLISRFTDINLEENEDIYERLIEQFAQYLHRTVYHLSNNEMTLDEKDQFLEGVNQIIEEMIDSPNKKMQLENVVQGIREDLDQSEIGGGSKKQYGKGPGMSVPAKVDDPIEPYSILVITTHGGYSDFDDIEINSNIDFTKINAVKPGVCNYLDGENADDIVRFLENEKYYNTYSYESSVELLPSIMKILDPYAADPNSDDDKRFILTKINEINKTGKIDRDLLEYNYNLLRNGSYIKYSAPKGSQYVDKDFEVFSSEKKKENQYLYFNGIILINKDGVEDILPLMTRRITRQTKKNFSVYLSSVLDFLYEERGVEKVIIIDLSCGTTSDERGARRAKRASNNNDGPIFGGKKQFLYNPNNPKKSFDVYIDKNPDDTIPIKYTTVEDVENTIKKLERLYKQGKYPHKRIWQVAMIMKVRLEAMKKHKRDKYPNAKNVTKRFNLSKKYFKFLGKRSKTQKNKRKKMTFKV